MIVQTPRRTAPGQQAAVRGFCSLNAADTCSQFGEPLQYFAVEELQDGSLRTHLTMSYEPTDHMLDQHSEHFDLSGPLGDFETESTSVESAAAISEFDVRCLDAEPLKRAHKPCVILQNQRSAFRRQCRLGDSPSIVLGADTVFYGNAHVREEDLAEF